MSSMSLSRKYIWVIVILGMIFSSVVIVFIFLLINKCVFRTGKHKIEQLQRKADSKTQSNKYQERNVDLRNPTPPLPSRSQFLTAEAQSYENLAEEPDYEQIPEYEQSTDHQPDYVKVEESDILHSPSFYNNPNPQIKANSLDQSYENLAENDYEESTDQPDYVQADDEADPGPDIKSGGLLSQICRNLSEDHDYEESTDQPDYVQADDEADSGPDIKSGGLLSQICRNLSEDHDYEESTDQLDYVQADDEADHFPPPPPPSLYSVPNPVGKPDLSLGQSCGNLSEDHDYEESMDLQSDYMKVEDEKTLLSHSADPESGDASSEDYDDIGGDDDEDYDDVV